VAPTPQPVSIKTTYPSESGTTSVPTVYVQGWGPTQWLDAHWAECEASFLVDPIVIPETAAEFRTSWPTAGGTTHTVITPYEEGWTTEQWWEAHKARVRADLRTHPIVIPG
jgi:hypothetical protein